MLLSLIYPQNEVVVQKRLYTMMQIILCSGLIALCAQIRIMLPFTPVPITLQTFAILLIGGMLGKRNGALAVLLYLAEAGMGLPVLAGGRSNPLAFIGPLGGYIFGWVILAYLAGWFMEKRMALGKGLAFVGLLGSCAVQLLCGGIWLGFFVGWENILIMGIIPFIPGEILKVIATTAFFNRHEPSRI